MLLTGESDNPCNSGTIPDPVLHTVLLDNQRGTFKPNRDVFTPLPNDPGFAESSVAVGDLDGDGLQVRDVIFSLGEEE